MDKNNFMSETLLKTAQGHTHFETNDLSLNQRQPGQVLSSVVFSAYFSQLYFS